MTTRANMAKYILSSVRISRAIGRHQLQFGNFVPTWAQARLANSKTTLVDPDMEWAEEVWTPNEFGVTPEDLAEFRARNEERGTAYGHWY